MTDHPVRRGLRRQLRRRAQLLAAGQGPLGWKAAFGAPVFIERFGLDGPVVGFMTGSSVRPDGAVVDISGWTRGVAEPEIAVYLGADLSGRPNADTVVSSVAAIGPAIELADIDLPFDDLEEIVAGDIFHRGVILGSSRPPDGGLDLSGVGATVHRDGETIAATGEIEALTGNVVEVLAHLTGLLTEQGESMRSGEVVICGSVVPPIELGSGATIEFRLDGFDPISVTAR